MKKAIVGAVTAATLAGSVYHHAMETPGRDHTIRTYSHGEEGNNHKVKNLSLAPIKGFIDSGLSALYKNGYCHIDMYVHDLERFPRLKRAASGLSIVAVRARAEPGGDIYLSSNIDPKKDDVKYIVAHEGLHACVRKTRRMERIPATISGQYVRGFSLAYKKSDDWGLSALDEAAVDWLATKTVGNKHSKDNTYQAISKLFGSIVSAHHISANDVAALHEDSDLTGLVEAMTSKDATTLTIGCVVSAFAELHAEYISPQKARADIQKC